MDTTSIKQISIPLLKDGNSSTSITVDANLRNFHQVIRTGSCTVTLTSPRTGSNPRVTIVFVHEASTNAYTVAFSPVPLWSGGTAPTFTNTSSAIDMVSLIWDGAHWIGWQTPDHK